MDELHVFVWSVRGRGHVVSTPVATISCKLTEIDEALGWTDVVIAEVKLLGTAVLSEPVKAHLRAALQAERTEDTEPTLKELVELGCRILQRQREAKEKGGESGK